MNFVDRDRLLECVHCGLCLSACPTYVELGTEMDSPRGRIYLMRALEEGSLELTADVVRHLDLCLGCLACETACPSGVAYGELIEATRAHVEANHRRPASERWWRRAIARVFPYPRRLAALLAPARVLERIGLLQQAARLIPALRLLPRLGGREKSPPELIPAVGAERARVGLLSGCVARELFAETNRAAIRVLTRNGVAVVVPRSQGCCGALHLHGGDPDAARELAQRNLAAFPPDLDAIVVTAAGCGATMKRYAHLFATGRHDDPGAARRAEAFATRVRDVTEILAALPVVPPERRLDLRVTYHDPCHLAHGQQVREAPRALLRAIPGIELVELAESELCCGSAGTYNLTEPGMARRLAERKIANIVATGATCVATANPGCSLQIQAGLRARGLDIPVVHPVELLDRAYGRA
jgi:glycolate oxidase iron-sulfur subunit